MPKGKRVSVRVTRRWAILVDFRSLDETYHAVGTQVRRFGRRVVKQGGGVKKKCVGECVGPSEARGGGNVLLAG